MPYRILYPPAEEILSLAERLPSAGHHIVGVGGGDLSTSSSSENLSVKTFRRSYRAFPAGTYPSGPDPLISTRLGPEIHRIGSKSGQNQVKIGCESGGRDPKGVGSTGVGLAGKLCSSSESLDLSGPYPQYGWGLFRRRKIEVAEFALRTNLELPFGNHCFQTLGSISCFLPFTGPYPQYDWDFPEEIPKKFRKDPATLSERFLEFPSRVQLSQAILQFYVERILHQ